MFTGWKEGNTESSGIGLSATYWSTFAYLSDTGVIDSQSFVPETFPVVVGEFGVVFNSSFNSTLPDHSGLPVSPGRLHNLHSLACQSDSNQDSLVTQCFCLWFNATGDLTSKSYP